MKTKLRERNIWRSHWTDILSIFHYIRKRQQHLSGLLYETKKNIRRWTLRIVWHTYVIIKFWRTRDLRRLRMKINLIIRSNKFKFFFVTLILIIYTKGISGAVRILCSVYKRPADIAEIGWHDLWSGRLNDSNCGRTVLCTFVTGSKA